MATDCEPPSVDAPKPKCRVCENEATTRGLCPKCYSVYQGLVKKGETTWEALETCGLALPSKRKDAGPNVALEAFRSMSSPSGKPEGAA